MRVLTLNTDEFIKKCRELRQRFDATYGAPDLIVGIATGGEFVARQFAHPFEHVEVVRRQRVGSSAKNGVGRGLLSRLPVGVSDMLRIAESRFYHVKWKLQGAKPLRPKLLELSADLVSTLQDIPAGGTVALVDDAADSGETLLTVKEALKMAAPDLKIVSCVLTVTREEASQAVDLALWNNGTLIRFPWSADFK